MKGGNFAKIFKITFAVLATGLLLILIAVPLVIVKYHDLETQKPVLEKVFRDFLQRRITIESIDFQIFPVPGLTGQNVILYEDDDEIMAEAPEVVLAVDVFDSWKTKKLQLSKLSFVDPVMDFRVERDGTIPLQQMIKDIIQAIKEKKANPGHKPPPYVFRVIDIDDGIIRVIDKRLKSNSFNSKINVDGKGEIVSGSDGKTFPFNVQTSIFNQDEEGEMDIHGTLGKNMGVSFSSRKLPFKLFEDYYPLSKHLNGFVAMEGSINKDSTGTSFSLSGLTKDIKVNVAEPVPVIGVDFDIRSSTHSIINGFYKTDESYIETNLQLPPLAAPAKLTGVIHGKDVSIADLRSQVIKIQSLFVEDSTSSVKNKKSSGTLTADIVVDVDKFIFKDIVFEDVDFQLERKANKNIYLNNIEADLSGGTFKGNLSLLTKENDNGIRVFDRYDIDWDISEVDLDPITKSLIEKQRFNGIGSSYGHLSGSLKFLDWSHTSGEIELDLRDGTVWNSPSLLKTFSALNITSLLRSQKSKSNGKDGLSYDSGKAKVVLTNGLMEFKKAAYLENETLKIGFRGKINFIEETVKGQIMIEFLGVVDEVLSVVPFVKNIIYKGKKTWLPVLVNVEGPMNDPKTQIQPAQSVSKTVVDAFSGVISAPFDLFKRGNDK